MERWRKEESLNIKELGGIIKERTGLNISKKQVFPPLNTKNVFKVPLSFLPSQKHSSQECALYKRSRRFYSTFSSSFYTPAIKHRVPRITVTMKFPQKLDRKIRK